MKKILLFSIFLTFAIPSITYASWWNPFSWNIFKRPHTQITEPASVKNLNEVGGNSIGIEDNSVPSGFISDKEVAALEQGVSKLKKIKNEDELLWGRIVTADEGYRNLSPEVKGKVVKFFKTYKKYDPQYGTEEGSDYKKLDDKWWENFDIRKGDTVDRLYSAHQDLSAEISNKTKKKNPMFLGKECLDEYCSLEIKMELAKRQLESTDYGDVRRPRPSQALTDETSSSFSSGNTLSGYSNDYISTFNSPDFSSASYNPAPFAPQNTTRSSFDITPTAGAGSYYTDSFGTVRYSGEGVSGALRTDPFGGFRYEDTNGYSANIKTDPFGGIRYSGNDGTSGTIKTDSLGTVRYQSDDGVSGTVRTDLFGNTIYHNNDGGTLTCSDDFIGRANCR